MKRVLRNNKNECYYFVDGKRKEGTHERISGDVSGLSGNVTGIRGDVSGLSGSVTGISGDVSGISGDVDEAELTFEERKTGVEISALTSC